MKVAVLAFQDHFSRVSEDYARYRPRYPASLFTWLAATGESRDRAWDCATGNGQAAVGLAEHFAEVVATDASAEQLRHAVARPNITYRQAGADASGLPSDSVDLVTCAQAVHWLPRDAFFAEARRVLHPGGVLAVWGYHIALVRDAAIDAAIMHFHEVVTGPYWPPERQMVRDRLRTIDFPFAELSPPEFHLHCAWTLDDLASYFGTQSATNRYRLAKGGLDPVPEFVAGVERRWGGRATVRDVYFPVFMRIGRI